MHTSPEKEIHELLGKFFQDIIALRQQSPHFLRTAISKKLFARPYFIGFSDGICGYFFLQEKIQASTEYLPPPNKLNTQ